MSDRKYPDWYHGPRGPSDEVKAQRKISARLKRIEAKLDAIGTAPQEAQADPKKDVCPNCGEVANGCNYCRKTPAPVPQTEGERMRLDGRLHPFTDESGKSLKDQSDLKPGEVRLSDPPETEGECPDCGGDGWYGGLKQPHCPTCSGTGKEKA